MTRHQSSGIFINTAKTLWGDQWQTAAADALGISLSSVVRYAKGERQIPRSVFETLSCVLDERLEVIERAKVTLFTASLPDVVRAGNGHA